MEKLLKEKIEYVEELAPGIFRMGINSQYIASNAEPGQFVNVKICESLENLLRRPISICRVSAGKGMFDIVFMKRGKGTEKLSGMKAGDVVDIIGPLGKGFHISDEYKRIAVVGGGIGIFPLLFLLESDRQKAEIKHAYLGFRSAGQAVMLEEFGNAADKVFISSDDGSIGEKGFVTGLFIKGLEDNEYDIIYTCGPAAMMEAVVKAAVQRGIPCQVSLEQRMGCGIGACLACAFKTRNEQGELEYSRVCKDGPVFWGDRVIFE